MKLKGSSKNSGGSEAPLSTPYATDMDLNRILTLFWNSGIDMEDQPKNKTLKPKRKDGEQNVR
jgi:hypothetical protein